MYTCSIDEKIGFVDLRSKKVINSLNLNTPLTSLGLDKKGNFLVAGSYFGSLFGIDIRKPNTRLVEFFGHDSRIFSVDFEYR